MGRSDFKARILKSSMTYRDVVPFYFCFCCLWFGCQIQEIIAKANAMKFSTMFSFRVLQFEALLLNVKTILS